MTIFVRTVGAACLLTMAVGPVPLAAQREIVQPLPPEGADRLNAALTRLALNAADVSALLDAGEASLDVGDIEAAIGFFGRAKELSPTNSRVMVGLGKAYARSRRPIEALRWFADAERSGVGNDRMAVDRALAFDLVGDGRSAQELYRLALQRGADAEVQRRLALSLAISGKRDEFEQTLLPLLEQQDLAAFRTRAFGLAILGDTKAAISISDAMLPPRMAASIRPYLEYMPRLTQSQQAAAGALGIFPRAVNIGKDDPAIAAYSPRGMPGASESSRLAAVTEDPRAQQRRRRPDQTRSRPDSVAAATPQNLLPDNPVAASESDRVATKSGAPQPALLAPVETRPAPSLEEAFASFTLQPSGPAPAAAGAVDITQIDVPREQVEPPAPETPPVPARHWVQIATGKDRTALGFDWRRLARQAEGRLDGLGPFVTPWGEANRLLAGPFENGQAAREMVNELKELSMDTFTFRSAEGEEIEQLD